MTVKYGEPLKYDRSHTPIFWLFNLNYETVNSLLLLCTWGAVYGCLEIHLDFIKVVCFILYPSTMGSPTNGGAGVGGGRGTIK